MAKRIQKRLVAVLGYWIGLFPTEKSARAPPIPRLPLEARALSSTHKLVDIGLNHSRAFCGSCGPSPCGLRAKQKWLRTGCIPNSFARASSHVDYQVVPSGVASFVGNQPLDPSHKLLCYRGLYICHACGHYSGLKVRGLGITCSGKISPIGLSILKRFVNGLPPYGLSGWPSTDTQDQFVDLDHNHYHNPRAPRAERTRAPHGVPT